MRISRILWASIALLSSSVTLATPVDPEVPPRTLTQADFSTSTAQGLWLIKFFSPYCIHCKKFAPTWKDLVSEKGSSHLGFQMAEIDCIAQGDLCAEQKVDHYPKVILYHKGEALETYKGDRSLEDLKQYIDDRVATHLTLEDVYPPPAGAADNSAAQENLAPRAIPNTIGDVLKLDTTAAFDSVVGEGPLFVKMFAPWCGHCKKLAPVWKDLAKNMQGVLNVAEVNCEDNSALCRREAVEGYPMLFFYQNGHRLDYRGPRKLTDLEVYARKAVAASAGLQTLDLAKLDSIILAEPAFFLYLHAPNSDYSEAAQKLVRQVAIRHAGGAPIYTSSVESLFTEFSVPHEPVLISIKDHLRTGAAFFYLSSAVEASGIAEHSHDLDRFLAFHRFPSAFELTSTNFQEVMRASTSDVVVLVPLDKEDDKKKNGKELQTQVEKELASVHKSWSAKVDVPNGRTLPALFVWMDSDRWEDWLENMYKYKKGDHEKPRAILADHKHLTYYDGAKGQTIGVNENDITAALLGYAKGTIELKHSEGWFARKARLLHDSIDGMALGLAHHPVRTVLIIVGGLVLFLALMERWTRDPAPSAGGLGRSQQQRPREKMAMRGRRLD